MRKVATFNDFLDLFPYGVSELRRAYQRYLTIALAISVGLHLALLGSFYLGKYVASREEAPPDRIVRLVKYAELGPPPSIAEQAAPPALAVSMPVARPSIGIPVPVPEAEVSEDATIATQQELAQMTTPVTAGMGGDSLVVTGIPEVEPGIDDFVAVEVEPVAIVEVKPNYPEVARLAEVEGTVYVKVLVDKEGKV